MSAQTKPITERQLELITRAYSDTAGLIEPLLTLKGGAKLKMIASLAQRALIAQQGGQWRLTPAAVAIVKGSSQTQDVTLEVAQDVTPDELQDVSQEVAQDDSPTLAADSADPAFDADDPELEAAVMAAETSWQQDQPANVALVPKRSREHSKQAQVIEMLQRPEGATIAQIMGTTGWQAHTIRGTFAGAFKKKLGLIITSDKAQGGERIYRAAA